MKKSIFTTLSASLVLAGLVGCQTNDEALDDRYDNSTRPIGYFSNDDRNMHNDYNNGRGMDQGPLTDMFDLNDNREEHFINTRLNNDSRGMNGPNGNVDRRNSRNGDLARRIDALVERINDVEDANTVVYGDTILVAVDTNDRNDNDVEQRVEDAVRRLAAGKTVRVVTDENMFNRIGTVNDGLRNGGTIDDFQSDLREIMNDIGDAMKRPFDANE
jgi:spore cortex protein